jgi:hypothetical protein
MGDQSLRGRKVAHHGYARNPSSGMRSMFAGIAPRTAGIPLD